ncbi:RimK family protein [Marinobacter lutaoensis]|jgi:glutathione synthase/RimK-type ligase-like ATP-grasp enzyme|uniref:Glutaminyl transferase n=1 Tax=Marinobacter lutaoensis TaxID=135739 RepID=A0A1V2DTZ9_9GAMM|nr:RimK family protein [Marinobacter lutaoensis]MBE01789.1 RimK family alpha-L-glutamate ligase [Marinobacter sp.]MBI42059.1 RimK family alpha-L-glutamate ligase [Oceanospirillales bacterium]NVD36191.1 RimK family protein [Marinobacter lutaoensis]ONF43930.1 glutaminyl transferase [Marinobacter lutaoensis]|tara:strand:- start:727 stop:2226 length:1500 start_codon:yes stop_codon:yes gene_type:complete
MSRLLIVVDRAKDWAPYYPSEDVLTFDQYLQYASPATGRVRVINLCQSSKYLSKGYYCSLLAEARGHNVVPSVMTLNDLSRKGLFSLQLDELDRPVVRWLEKAGAVIEPAADEREATHEVRVRSFFGQVAQPELKLVARALFERFPCPILEIVFKRRKQWQIDSLRPGAPSELDESEQDQFAAALDRFSSIVWRKPRSRRRYRFDLAVLVNPEEELPPSDETALKRFERAGRKLGINVERITRRDYMRLPEYDGLFIRETTAIDHHTYRFARKAEAEGMVVIDDPVSILRCTNKVFLADLLKNNKVPTPKTLILSKDQKDAVARVVTELGLPVVIKIPDGAFSRGVIKARDEAELASGLKSLFRQSALVLAQEYFYTEYDWRIGVLGGRAIYACKYMMVKGHWQIYQHGESRVESGGFETLPTYEVPRNVIQAALNATRLIGNGLYGVDIKQSGNRVAVIEVNDNPSIDSGVEDKFLGGELYTLIMQEFLTRMEDKRRG